MVRVFQQRTTTAWRTHIVAAACAAALSCVPARAAPQGQAQPPSAQPLDPAYAGEPIDPAWPKRVYVMTDSVLLGAKEKFIKGLSDWQVTYAGRPALMIYKALAEVRQQSAPLGPVAVVALGYNSLWQKNRENFPRWSALFDKNVEDMLAALKQRGARKIVWVLLRELTPELVGRSRGAVMQYNSYAWYFPYVNERLRAIKLRHPEMALADWPNAARRSDVTYDAIHLNPRGAALMVEVVKAAIGIDAAQPAAAPRSAVLAAATDTPAPARPAEEQARPMPQEKPRLDVAPVVAPVRKVSHRTRREAMFALSEIGFADVVMLGDSLTEMAQWSEITPCHFVANRGIGADDSAGVLRRLDDVTKLAPKAVFLMIGVNDVASKVPTEDIVANVRQTVDKLAAGGTHVYLALVLPVAEKFRSKINGKIDELNAAYRQLADRTGVSLVDFRSKVSTGDGFLRDDMTLDGIHLTAAGYRVWRDAIAGAVTSNCPSEAALRPDLVAAKADDRARMARSAPSVGPGTASAAVVVSSMPPSPGAAPLPPGALRRQLTASLAPEVTTTPRPTTSPQTPPQAPAVPAPAASADPAAGTAVEPARARIDPARGATAAAAQIDADPTASIQSARPGTASGGWMIQVGAYPEEYRAVARIRLAQAVGKSVLGTSHPFTEKVTKGRFTLYRARFAGFDGEAAQRACSLFKDHKIDCFSEAFKSAENQ